MSRVNHYANIEGIPGLAEAIYLAGGITALAIDMGTGQRPFRSQRF